MNNPESPLDMMAWQRVPRNESRLRLLLWVLVFVLTFEGVVRKAVPVLGIPLFFMKDCIVTIMAFYVVQMPEDPAISSLWTAYKTLVVAFLPLIILTGWHDVLLAVFGAKQYLLFPMVGFAFFYAFRNARTAQILTFFRWASLLIIPTAVLAYVQLHLPHDHWLNMAVNGDSLERFAAAGQLRVSSTFSFVAQYCAFLNAQLFIIMLAWHEWRKRNVIWMPIVFSLLPFLVFSSFITGSRGAVTGNISIILGAVVLCLLKFQFRKVLQIGVVVLSLYLIVLAMQHYAPQALAAYSERENGQLIGFSSDVKQRIYQQIFDAVPDITWGTIAGHGLGIMSNGSDVFSTYAAVWRGRLWTETDLSTTFFEGGYYLVIAWYGFRFYVICLTISRFIRDISSEFILPIAFSQAFVVVIGLLGTLAIQPPISIWWWLAVGTTLTFCWKSVAPPEPEIPIEPNLPPPPPARKLQRGRSLYADVLHNQQRRADLGVKPQHSEKAGQ